MERINIHNVLIHNVTMQEAVDQVQKWALEDPVHTVYTPNSEIIMQAQRNPDLKNILNNADLLIPDGAGVVLASKMLKRPLKEKVSGVDLVKNLFAAAAGKNISFFILGGEPGVAEMAAVNIISEYGKVNIKGYAHGYFKPEEEDSLIEEINKANPDILLVGLGAPKQEFWIYNNMYRLKSRVCIGIGGSIDIFAGKIALTPEFIRKAGFEWLHRLIRQPKRIKRMVDLPKFMLITLKKRFTR